MSRKKLIHFEEMKKWPNVFEPTFSHAAGGGFKLDDGPQGKKGKWGELCACAQGGGVVLELGCGKGDYTLGLAEMKPSAVVVGVDIKGARLWAGAHAALEKGLSNAFFLRAKIESLPEFFADGEVDEIWITFPTPHPAGRNEKRRLTSPRFLEIYRKLLKPCAFNGKGGALHLKTDSRNFYLYSLEIARAAGFKIVDSTDDLYGICARAQAEDPARAIQTTYEKKYLAEGRKICYMRSELRSELLIES
jgi:tRNA (guanine-N7-)-methyltransferase